MSDDLVKRLRLMETAQAPWPPFIRKDYKEAADALEAKDKEITALKEQNWSLQDELTECYDKIERLRNAQGRRCDD